MHTDFKMFSDIRTKPAPTRSYPVYRIDEEGGKDMRLSDIIKPVCLESVAWHCGVPDISRDVYVAVSQLLQWFTIEDVINFSKLSNKEKRGYCKSRYTLESFAEMIDKINETEIISIDYAAIENHTSPRFFDKYHPAVVFLGTLTGLVLHYVADLYPNVRPFGYFMGRSVINFIIVINDYLVNTRDKEGVVPHFTRFTEIPGLYGGSRYYDSLMESKYDRCLLTGRYITGDLEMFVPVYNTVYPAGCRLVGVPKEKIVPSAGFRHIQTVLPADKQHGQHLTCLFTETISVAYNPVPRTRISRGRIYTESAEYLLDLDTIQRLFPYEDQNTKTTIVTVLRGMKISNIFSYVRDTEWYQAESKRYPGRDIDVFIHNTLLNIVYGEMELDLDDDDQDPGIMCNYEMAVSTLMKLSEVCMDEMRRRDRESL